MTRLLKLPLAAAFLCGAVPALAADAGDAADAGADAQSDIVVTGQRPEYGARSTSTATKTNTDVKDVPQALTVISESQIEDQQLRSISDLLLFVPGATPATGESNRDQIVLRGNNTTADFFVDGIRDDVQYFRDFYNIERVEVLRGPNAMIFGRGGGGGIVNRVLKRSTLNPYRELRAAADGFGGFRFTADVDQPLSSRVGLRLDAMYEDGDSFRRHVDLKRYGINPTAALLIGPNSRIDIGYEYLRDRRTADRGVPSRAGRPLEGFDRTFFGDPDKSFSRANVHLASFALEHRLAGGLTLRNRTLYGDYDKYYQNIYPNGAVTPAGTVRLSAYSDATTRRNLFSQTDLIWDAQLGGISQTLLFGFELGRQSGNNHRHTGVFAASGTSPTFLDVPITQATVNVPIVRFATKVADNDIKATVAAIYVQDQIRPADWLEIVAGLRFDRLRMEIDNLNSAQEFARTDELWSPRLGLVLKPLRKLSAYASYSRSYLPQSGDQFNSLAANTQTLKPERFDNYELGAKWEPIEGLLATAAIYQLDRTNTRLTDPLDPTRFVLTGKQRSRGLELGLERSVTNRWQISAGYALQKARVTRATSACPSGDCEVPLVPRHSFSLWNRYDVTRQVGIGLGAIARSKSYASISNAVVLPGYTRLDAALFYKLPHGIQAQVNFENLLGADYFPTAHNDNNIASGAPRTVKASLGYRF
ncbi:MAG TPA: TonB-dependent siderophore receptor [Sphingomicrobium sp.]|nr:TonB-dependent siderophore receptor [Sphingomicrobium sp.]